METFLPREAFIALAAVAWADGRMRKTEAASLQRAAQATGVSGEDLAVLADACERGASLDEVDLSALSPWQHALTYAFANWLAKLDGVVNAEEVESLRQLGKLTGLADTKLAAARSAAFDIAMLPGGARPEKYDLDALELRLQEKLPALYRASVPPG